MSCIPSLNKEKKRFLMKLLIYWGQSNLFLLMVYNYLILLTSHPAPERN